MTIDYEYKRNSGNFGLKPHRRDWRDYSHHRTFGAAPLDQLPEEYLLLTDILDQDGLPQCTAYSACSVRAAQAGIEFDPAWFYAQEGVVNGAVSNDGYELRVTMQTGVDKGFKPARENDDPLKYKEAGYFSVDGSYDLFDNIRSAMWLAKNEKRCAELGTMWYKEWFQANNGVIQEHYETLTPFGLHAIKGAGWTKNILSQGKPITIDGKPYLAIQNSFGKNYGDGGIYYFPRSVVNREFVQGAFLWRLLLSDQQIKTAHGILDIIKEILRLIESWSGTKKGN